VARVGSGLPFMVRVWKISPKNMRFFNFFPFGSKKIALGWVKVGSASYLLRVKSKLGSCQGPFILVWEENEVT